MRLNLRAYIFSYLSPGSFHSHRSTYTNHLPSNHGHTFPSSSHTLTHPHFLPKRSTCTKHIPSNQGHSKHKFTSHCLSIRQTKANKTYLPSTIGIRYIRWKVRHSLNTLVPFVVKQSQIRTKQKHQPLIQRDKSA